MFIYKYAFAAAGINGLFGLYRTYNAKVIRKIDNDRYNKNQIINNMLIGEKITVVLFHTIVGPYVVPIHLLHLFNQLEIKYRNDNLKNYNYDFFYKYNNKNPKELIDYYFP